ncbi:MAG: hypothetical protein Q9217_006628, partial [Psora testacea]
DADARPDALLIVGTSLAIDSARDELKKNLISAVRGNYGKAIYVNNSPPPSAMGALFDYVFRVDCDRWVQGIHTCEPSLREGVVRGTP